MSDELVGQYVDRGAFSSDTAFVKDELEKVITLFDQIKDIRINLQGTSSLKDLVSSVNDGAKASDQFVASTKKVTDAVEQQRAKLAQASSEQGQQIAELRVQTAEQNKANKEAAIQTLGLRDAYQQLNQEYIAAQKSAKALQAAARLDPALQQEADIASQKANALGDALKRIDAGVGQFQRNVGNYTGAITILQKGLAEATAQLNAMSQAERTNTTAGQQLENQVVLLGTLVGQQSKGFSSLTTELRNSERALRTLYEAGFQDTAAFKDLQVVVNNATREVREFTHQQQLLSSESPAIAGLTAAARGLGSAYAIGAGATALFGDENGKVEKELQKLVAIMTILQGLTELNRFFQERAAIATSLNGVKTAFLAATQAVLAVVTKKTAVAQAELTVAQEASVSAQTASVAATEGQVTAVVELGVVSEGAVATTTELGVALEGEAVAATEAAAATSTFAAVLAATGVGALILAVGAAVVYVVSKINDWIEATHSQYEANDELKKSLNDLIDATVEYERIRSASAKAQLDDLKAGIEQEKEKGKTTLEGLALDKIVAKERLKIAQDAIAAQKDNFSDNKQTIEFLQKSAENDARLVEKAQESRTSYLKFAAENGDKDYEKNLAAQDRQVKSAEATAAQSKKISDFASGLIQERTEAENELYSTNLKIQKETQDESRKGILDAAKLEVDTNTFVNNRILADDKSTLDQRTKALADNLKQRIVLLNAENQAIQSDPTVSRVDKTDSRNKTKEQITQAQKEEQTAIQKLREDFRQRDLAAQTDSDNAYLQEQDKFNKALYDNEALTSKQRLDALVQSQADRQTILDNNFKKQLSGAGISDTDIERIKNEGYFEIANKKITNQELLRLIGDYNNSVLSLSKDVAFEQVKISKDYYQQDQLERDKNLKKIQDDFDKSFEDRTDTYNNQIESLNTFYNQGKISAEKYAADRLKIENAYAIDAVKIEIDKQQKLIDEIKHENGIKLQLETELVTEQAKFASAQTDTDKQASADRIAAIKKELVAVTATFSKETDLYKALSALIKQLSEDAKKSVTDTQNQIIEGFNKARKAGEDFFSVVDGILNAVATRRKNDLQDQSDQIDESSAQEIAAINASAATAEDKAARVALVNERVAEQKAQIAKEEKQADVEQARFDKLKAIFEIVINTAIAVTKATTPIGKALAIAFGAAETAIVLATPIPRYKGGKGKGDNYEGPAIVNDGGRNEPILREDGTIDIYGGTPRDTMTWVGRNDVVYSSIDEMLRAISTPRVALMAPQQQTSEFAREMSKQRAILKSIANKKELSLSASDGGLTAVWRLGANRISYVEQNTNW